MGEDQSEAPGGSDQPDGGEAGQRWRICWGGNWGAGCKGVTKDDCKALGLRTREDPGRRDKAGQEEWGGVVSSPVLDIPSLQ